MESRQSAAIPAANFGACHTQQSSGAKRLARRYLARPAPPTGDAAALKSVRAELAHLDSDGDY